MTSNDLIMLIAQALTGRPETPSIAVSVDRVSVMDHDRQMWRIRVEPDRERLGPQPDGIGDD